MILADMICPSNLRIKRDTGTGKNSGHVIIRGVTISHSWDTVPTWGDLHFGETNPNVNGMEHFRRDVL